MEMVTMCVEGLDVGLDSEFRGRYPIVGTSAKSYQLPDWGEGNQLQDDQYLNCKFEPLIPPISDLSSTV